MAPGRRSGAGGRGSTRGSSGGGGGASGGGHGSPNRHPAGGHGSANRPPAGDPLAGVERVLVDGSNLAHALARSRGAGTPASARDAAGGATPASAGTGPTPLAGVIASIRAAFPPGVRVEVVFDGPGRPARAASNLFVEHAGRRSADRVIEEAVDAQLRADGPAGTWGVLVVTDDRELREIVQRLGARTAGTAWLVGRIEHVGGIRGPSGTSIGHRRPPAAAWSRDPNRATRDSRGSIGEPRRSGGDPR